MSLLPAGRRAELATRRPSIEMDSIDTKVFGQDKDGVAYNYQGQRRGRPHLTSWAEASLPLAADLLAGNADFRPQAAGLLRRALAALPAEVYGLPRLRADAGYVCAELAHAAVEAGCDFAIAAKRNSACWRPCAAVGQGTWTRPGHDRRRGRGLRLRSGRPAGHLTPTPSSAGSGSTLPRSPPTPGPGGGTQSPTSTLALDGQLDHVYAVSFLVTNLPVSNDADIVAVEAWFLGRVAIEERFREAKPGAGLRHLPVGDRTVDTVWTWAALPAGALSVMLQSLTGLDHARRARAARLRVQLLRSPARSSGTPAASPCGYHPASSCCPRSSPASEPCRPRPDRRNSGIASRTRNPTQSDIRPQACAEHPTIPRQDH